MDGLKDGFTARLAACSMNRATAKARMQEADAREMALMDLMTMRYSLSSPIFPLYRGKKKPHPNKGFLRGEKQNTNSHNMPQP